VDLWNFPFLPIELMKILGIYSLNFLTDPDRVNETSNSVDDVDPCKGKRH